MKDYKEMLKKLEEFLDSEEGQRSLQEFSDKYDKEKNGQESRFKKIDEYLKTHDFGTILLRLISEYTEEVRDRFYAKGIEPHPTGLLALAISYAEDRGSEVDSDEVDPENPFSNDVIRFDNFYFQTVCGQGCFNRIYDINKEIIFTS